MATSNGKTKIAKNAYVYAPCRVEPGMFKEEWLVYLDTIDPKQGRQRQSVQLFADQRLVAGIQGEPARRNPVPAWLRVGVFRTKGDLAQVVLPQPTASGDEAVIVDGKALQLSVEK